MKVYQLLMLTGLTASLVNADISSYTDGILAKVNSEIITVYDVAKATQPEEQRLRQYFAVNFPKNNGDAQAKFQEELTKLRVKAANEMIDHMVVFAEFKRKGFRLPPRVIEKRLDEIVNRNGGDWERFRATLQDQGQSLDDFRETVEKRMAVEVLLSQEVDSLVQVAPIEIEQWYQEHRSDYSSPPEIRLQALIIKRGGGSEGDFDARIQQTASLVRTETDFSKLVREHSEHFSAENDGDMGWMKVSDLSSEISDMISEYTKGHVAGPVRLNDDVWFVHLADVRAAVHRSFEEVRDSIEQQLYSQERTTRYASFIKKLRNQCFIRTYFEQ
ncbi:MAG TPA: hypothetical protein DCR55_09235 [Lentisphaeria bacterium]|nr:hypothetical protein [Lentisphaeria bacterium]